MQQSQSQSLDGMTQTQARGARFWRPAAVIGTLFGLIGFYEPAKDVYFKVFDPDYKEVEYVALAKQQQRLAQKNLVCAINMTRFAVQADHNTSLRYGVCENHDVLIEVYPENKPAFQQWISPENLIVEQPRAAGWFPAALAASILPPRAGHTPLSTPAQLELKTVCQAWQDGARKTRIVRITNEGGTCYRERINVLSGRVEIRELVPCDGKCDPRPANPVE